MMTSFERRRAVAVLRGFATDGGPDADFEGTLHTMESASTPLARLGMRLAVWLALLWPIWTLRGIRLLSSCPLEVRAEALTHMLRHRRFAVRELLLLLKIAASMALLAPKEAEAAPSLVAEPRLRTAEARS